MVIARSSVSKKVNESKALLYPYSAGGLASTENMHEKYALPRFPSDLTCQPARFQPLLLRSPRRRSMTGFEASIGMPLGPLLKKLQASRLVRLQPRSRV